MEGFGGNYGCVVQVYKFLEMKVETSRCQDEKFQIKLYNPYEDTPSTAAIFMPRTRKSSEEANDKSRVIIDEEDKHKVCSKEATHKYVKVKEQNGIGNKTQNIKDSKDANNSPRSMSTLMLKEGYSEGIDLLQFLGATATKSPFISKELNNAKGEDIDDSTIVELNGADDDDAADIYLNRIKRDLWSLPFPGPT